MPDMTKLSKYNTTWGRDNAGHVSVTYVHTVIVREEANAIILNNGGWDTVTTRRKMNQASNQFGLHYHVFQKAFETFVIWQGKCYPFNGRTLHLYKDGRVHLVDHDTGKISAVRAQGEES